MRPDPRPAVMAQFDDGETLRAAAEALRGRDLDAFTPYPVEGLARALGARRTRLPLVMLAGGIAGALAAYGLILYSVTIDYPINVGGRGLNAWPAYLVLAFEAGILGAAVAGVAGFLWANALPTYHHPVFDTPGFTFARGGGFWLMVPVDETDAGPVHDRLAGLGARQLEVLE